MVNPQESLDAGILTQFSEYSDLSDQTKSIDSSNKVGYSGPKLLSFEFSTKNPSSASSSPSFMSPGSPTDTTTVVTQPPSDKKMSAVIKKEPTTTVAKRTLNFEDVVDEENVNPQPSKKARITCCCQRNTGWI